MLAIWKREVQSYFLSPVAYVFIGFFMLVCGIFFATGNILTQNASFNATLGTISFLFMMVVPILTMRLLSEERKNKTDQLLLTAPVSVSAIVVGKYLAAVTVFLITLVISLVYPLVLAIFGQPSFGEIFAGYIGFFLLGCALISVGVFISALTESQVIAAVATFFILLILWTGNFASSLVKVEWIATVLKWLSVYTRFAPFTGGVLPLTPTVYFISFSAIFVFLAVRSVERRRWSKG